jgi:hypothetical protein
MLKIPFIPTIEFPYSTGDPLLIMSSPMSWQRPFFGCCPVAGEPSQYWIDIWPAESSLIGESEAGAGMASATAGKGTQSS